MGFKRVSVLLVLGAVMASAAQESFCGPQELEGNWEEIVITEEPQYSMSKWMDMAIEEFMANNGTLPCPQSYYSDLVAGCTKAAAGNHYRLLFFVECETMVTDATILLAKIFVPLPPNQDNVEVVVSEFGWDP